MRYNIDIEKFGRLLLDRPGLVKKLTSLDEQTAALFVAKSKKVYEYLSDELKSSIVVVRAYIKESQNINYSNTSYYNEGNIPLFALAHIPLSALAQLTLQERKTLIKRSCQSYREQQHSFMKKLPNKVYEEWLHAVKHGYSIEDVPPEFLTRKSLHIARAHHIKDSPHLVRSEIPEVFWEKDAEQANKDLIETIKITHYAIEVIPPERVTKDHLIATFQSGEEISLDDKYAKIPPSSWDKGVAAMALKCDPCHIRLIPPSLLTEDDAVNCVSEGKVSIESIPEKVLTRKVRVHLVAHSASSYTYENDTLLNDINFQLDVIRESGIEGATNIKELIKPENREAVLKICPLFLRYIPKLEQTDKIIDILLGSATSEQLDEVAQFINLGKIKKYHAPMLVGCTSNIILSTVEKKLKGREMSTEAKKTEKTNFTIEIDIAPVEFTKIRERLDQMRD